MDSDLAAFVYNAARRRQLDIMRFILDNIPKDQALEVASTHIGGSTPLIAGCREGFLDVVEYLIDEYDIDIEQLGSTYINGYIIEDGTPLFYAAAAGHLDVVKKLVCHNALVNAEAKNKSTPLLAACLYGHYGIVKYLIENGGDVKAVDSEESTCLMVACSRKQFEIASYLIQNGAEVNTKNLILKTPLHVCAEFGKHGIVQLLLDHGAEIQVDDCGMTPPLVAAVNCQTAVVECFIKNKSCTLVKEIDAYKMLGATFLDTKGDSFMAIAYWKKALKLLNQDVNSPILKPANVPLVEAYNNEAELNTYEQLEEIKEKSESMGLQALIMRERILGPGNPITLKGIHQRGLWYSKIGNLNQCIKLWIHQLTLQQKIMNPLNWSIQTSLLFIIDEMYKFISKSVSDRHLLPTCLNYMLTLFYHITKTIESMMPCKTKHKLDFDLVLTIAVHLIGLFSRLLPHLSNDDQLLVMQVVNNLVHLNPRSEDGEAFLHISCTKKLSFYTHSFEVQFPSIEVTELLLKAGACPNARDDNGNTPLHTIASNISYGKPIFKLLLDNGAHLDFRNDKRKTALDILPPSHNINIFPFYYLNLKCICAQVVHKAKIPFNGLVPTALEKFLNDH